MRILRKRIFAFIVDVFIYAFIYYLLQLFVISRLTNPNSFVYILALSPLFFRDAIFKNASIGKRLFGLRIYNLNWETPKFWQTVKRSLFMMTIGYFLLLKAKLHDGDMLRFFTFEENKCGTRVVDKATFILIQDEAKRRVGNETNTLNSAMSRVFNELLANHYLR